MQEAVEKHVEENAEPLNIDYSFLNDRENVKISPVKKRRTARSFARVAVILIVFFCGVSVAMVTDLPTNASAWKAQMARRLYVLKEGFVSSDPDVSVNFTDENTEKFLADNVEQIDRIRKMIPELLELEYIPYGYSFDVLKIDRAYNGLYNAIYEFVGADSDYFSVNIYYNPSIDYSTTNVDNVVEMIELEEKVIYVWQDNIEETYGATMCYGHYIINIIGSIDSDDMIDVAKNLK